jgi:hypothetical protein
MNNENEEKVLTLAQKIDELRELGQQFDAWKAKQEQKTLAVLDQPSE